MKLPPNNKVKILEHFNFYSVSKNKTFYPYNANIPFNSDICKENTNATNSTTNYACNIYIKVVFS